MKNKKKNIIIPKVPKEDLNILHEGQGRGKNHFPLFLAVVSAMLIWYIYMVILRIF